MTESREYPVVSRRERRPGEIRSLNKGGVEGFLVHRWRQLLLVVAVILIASAALPQFAKQGTSSEATKVAGNTPTVAPGSPIAGGQIPSPTRTADTRPQPSPTPNTVRPLALTVAPKLASNGRAPARKPGTPDPQPSTDRFIVMDGDSGAILFEQNSRDPIAMASLTKIMTAIIGIEHAKLDDRPKIDIDARSFADSTVMGLAPGMDLTFEDLLYGLMLPSGNDAAVAIAKYVAGDEKSFVRLMNEKAAWLGLKATHFVNPHGLDASDHYSSPYDMAVMSRYGMQYPEFRKLAAARSHDISQSNIAYTVLNLNPILGTYPGADGVKIGFTDNAGRSIVASATRGGHRVFVAFMRSTAGLAPDSVHLLDWAFAYHTWPD